MEQTPRHPAVPCSGTQVALLDCHGNLDSSASLGPRVCWEHQLAQRGLKAWMVPEASRQEGGTTKAWRGSNQLVLGSGGGLLPPLTLLNSLGNVSTLGHQNAPQLEREVSPGSQPPNWEASPKEDSPAKGVVSSTLPGSVGESHAKKQGLPGSPWGHAILGAGWV